MSRRKQARPRPMRGAEEDGILGDAPLKHIEEEQITQEKETMMFDDDAEDSSDSDAFHIDLKGDEKDVISPTDEDSSSSDRKQFIMDNCDNITAVSTESGEKAYICPVCNIQLDNLRLLTCHIRNHNSKVPSSHSCTICGKVLCSQSSLDRHMLVHSGERPFKCQICNLAFTTNGNMHRHMRVHEKEFAKSPQALKEMLDAGLISSYPPEGRRVRKRRQPMTDSDVVGEQKSKRPSVDDSGASFSKKHDDGEKPVCVALKKKLGVYNGEMPSPSKELLPDSEDVQESSKAEGAEEESMQSENDEVEQLHCPVCDKGFICKYGLQSHLETHPQYPICCSICNASFPNMHGLKVHALMVHGRMSGKTLEEMKRNGRKSSVPVGFHDLGFVDFSIDKFPLIAKSWCEHNTRRSSSSFHNFECTKCQKAFPCGGALQLHKESHTPETTATCDICGCDFESSAALKEHRLNHTADRILSTDTSKCESDNESNVSKEDFLAMLSLQGQPSDENDSDDSSSDGEKIDAKLNREYFCKIGQVDAVPSESSNISTNDSKKREENNNSNDFADIQKIIQTANVGGLPALSESPVKSASLPPTVDAMPRLQHISQMFNVHKNGPGIHSPPPLHPVPNRFSMKQEPYDPELMTVPLDETGSSDPDASTDETKQKFTCKYCDTGFETFNAMKVHMRTHLGLSPYKCNMCSYSSADKTTLIRHLRTHNGERPFQCKICDFAFTTKANCERHARKKHKLESKEEIDAAVGYNQYMQEGSPKSEGDFHSPDTICKYCGIDFKFFRALKHHLRSHSSCRQKPFVCLLCSIGFSTKANCIRHIQKRHPGIKQNEIERNIRTNIPAAHFKPKMEGSFPDIMGSMMSTMTPMGFASATPPPAHHNKAPHVLFPAAVSQGSSLETHSSKPALFGQHTDGPLDFSKKELKEESPNAVLNLIKKEPMPANHDDEENDQAEPMDLTTGKRSSEANNNDTSFRMKSDAIVVEPQILKPGEIAPGVGVVSPMMHPSLLDMNVPQPAVTGPYNIRTYRCPVCQVQFSQEAKLYLHMRTHTTNRPFQCSFCPAGFTIKTNLDIHVRTRHLNDNGSLPTPIRNRFIPPTLKMIARRRQSGGFGPHSYLRPKYMQFRTPSTDEKKTDESLDTPLPPGGSGSGSDSNCELASVSKILNTTSADHFQAFFRSSSETSADDKANVGIEMMKSGVKETEARKVPATSPKQPENSEKNVKEEKTSSPEGQTPPVKKKRNSYANAPNRVSCPYCSRTFPWISSLRRHILTHTGQKPYKCPECSVHFSTKSNRERHLLRKHGLNPNNPHTRQIMDRPYKCQLCVFSSFSKPEKLIMHYKSKHPDVDPPSNVQNIASLERWERSCDNDGDNLAHPLINTSDSEGDETGITEDGDKNYDAVKETESDGDFDHDDDDDDDKIDDEMTIIRKGDPKQPLQPIALDYLVKKEVTSHHMLPQMSTSSSPISRVSPLPSPSSHPSPSPRPSPSTRTVINPERDNYNVDKILDCWQCGLHFGTRKMLLRHLKEHNIDYPFKCYLCDASYLTRRECLEHKAQKHPEDWDGLRVRNKIDEIPEFVDVMEKLGDPSEDRGDETRGKDDTVPEDVAVSAVERKVYCALCPKKFWSLQDLRRHMRSHTGEKPFECDICGRYFTLKHSMMRHRRKHQDGETNIRPKPGSYMGDMFKSEPAVTDSNEDNHAQDEPDVNPFMSYGKESHVFPSMSVPRVAASARGPRGLGIAEMGSDLLGNLLGVDKSALDQMLDSADSANSVAAMLGVAK